MSEPSVVREWFYSVNGQSFGPVTEAELAALAAAGYFGRDDYVFAPYLGNWVVAKSVHGLFDGVTAPGAEIPDPSAPLYVPGPRSPFGPEVALGYAGFWRRFLAEFIDTLLLLPLLGPAVYFLGLLFVGAAESATGAYAYQFVSLDVMFVVMWIIWMALKWPYYVLLESSRLKGTLGKRAAGLIVTDIFGHRLSLARANARYLFSWISMLAAFCGYLMMPFTARRQTLHDILTGTIVLDTELLRPTSPSPPENLCGTAGLPEGVR